MKLSSKAGFTIIETMLFLAITGFLIAGFLVGTGNTINNQRYRDSVQSLAATLQQQYSDVLSVNSPRGFTSSMTCSSAGDVTSGGSDPKRIGQSDCVVLGKYITYINDGTYNDNAKKIVTRTVIGSPKPSTDPMSESSDIASLLDYNIKPIAPDSSSDSSFEWGSTLVPVSGNSPFSFSILILRSPLSGSARTFINNTGITPDASIGTLIQNVNLTNSLKMCVKSDKISGIKKSAVMILANTTATSGVQTQGDGNSGCN